MWSISVIIPNDTGGRYVRSPVEALHILDGWWQKVDGPAYQNAINVCIAAIRNEVSPEDARAAFVSALSEGGVILGPTD